MKRFVFYIITTILAFILICKAIGSNDGKMPERPTILNTISQNEVHNPTYFETSTTKNTLTQSFGIDLSDDDFQNSDNILLLLALTATVFLGFLFIYFTSSQKYFKPHLPRFTFNQLWLYILFNIFLI